MNLTKLTLAVSIITFVGFMSPKSTAQLTFSPEEVVWNHINAETVEAADLDGDSHLDLVFGAGTGANSFAWRKNNGDGTFQATIPFPVSNTQNLRCIKAADIDNDGDLDLVFGSRNNLRTILSDGAGGIVSQSTVDSGGEFNFLDIEIADLDGDGDLDIVAASFTMGFIATYENLGGGVFGPRQVVLSGIGFSRIDVADVSGTIAPDILFASRSDETFGYIVSNSFSVSGPVPSSFIIFNSVDLVILESGVTFPSDIRAADVDNDGDLDIVAAAENVTAPLRLYEQDNGFQPGQPIAAAGTVRQIDLADMDLDGNLDIVTHGSIGLNPFSVSVQVIHGLCGAAFATPMFVSTTGQGPRTVVAADLSGNGYPDVAAAAFNAETVTLILNEGFPPVTTFPYSEGFEAGNGGYVSGGANSTWALGTPSGAAITAAANGSRAWVTNLTGNYNSDEESYLESVTFDFTALTSDPILEFSHIFRTQTNLDETWVDISINSGPFTRLGSNASNGNCTSLNWYNDAGNQWWEGNSGSSWRTARYTIDGGAGNQVVIRWVLSSDDFFQFEGVGVDDVKVLLANPAFAPTSSYVMVNGMSLAQARLHAQSLGGHLVTIDSQAEIDFLAGAFGGLASVAYIGLSDEITEGLFLWDSGAPVSFTNWLPNEPSGNGNYVVMVLNCLSAQYGGWDDRGDNLQLPKIIEIPFGQTPQAGVAVLDINGATTPTGDPVSMGQPGPYYASAAFDGSLDFTFEGQAGQPIILLAGPLNPGVLDVAPFGQLDIGGPGFAGVSLVAAGSQPGFLNSLFVIGSAGITNMSFTVTPNLSGIVISLQAVIFNTTNNISFSNAVQLTVTPPMP